MITVLSKESAVITAKLNDKTFSCTVTVGGKDVIACPSISKRGDPLILTVTGKKLE